MFTHNASSLFKAVFSYRKTTVVSSSMLWEICWIFVLNVERTWRAERVATLSTSCLFLMSMFRLSCWLCLDLNYIYPLVSSTLRILSRGYWSLIRTFFIHLCSWTVSFFFYEEFHGFRMELRWSFSSSDLTRVSFFLYFTYWLLTS